MPSKPCRLSHQSDQLRRPGVEIHLLVCMLIGTINSGPPPNFTKPMSGIPPTKSAVIDLTNSPSPTPDSRPMSSIATSIGRLESKKLDDRNITTSDGVRTGRSMPTPPVNGPVVSSSRDGPSAALLVKPPNKSPTIASMLISSAQKN